MSDYCYDANFSEVCSYLNEINEKLNQMLEELKEKHKSGKEISNEPANRQQ